MGVPASAMLMPEASMDKDSQLVFGENQIGTSWKVLAVQTEAQTHAMGNTPDGQFGGRVTPADSGHQLASTLAIHNIGQTIFLSWG